MSIRVAINGFGRIGRMVYRRAMEVGDIDIVAVNGTANVDTCMHLLKYDSIHGTWRVPMVGYEDGFEVNGHYTRYFSTRDPSVLPWRELDIEDMAHFALATREAKKYNVPLDQLWLDMAEIQGKELEYVRRIRAETAHQRTGGYWFYGMLAGSFLVAYPFVSSYMSEVTRFFFWITLAVMTAGLYLIIRRSQVIEV